MADALIDGCNGLGAQVFLFCQSRGLTLVVRRLLLVTRGLIGQTVTTAFLQLFTGVRLGLLIAPV